MKKEDVFKAKEIVDKIEIAENAIKQLCKVTPDPGGYTPTLSTKFIKMFRDELIAMAEQTIEDLEIQLSCM